MSDQQAKITECDVLQRALTIMQAGPLVGTYAECGVWCPRCAIACAKSQLDIECQLSWIDDVPLEMARVALWRWRDIDTRNLDQPAALDILQTALNEVSDACGPR